MDQETINYLVECAKQGDENAFAQLYNSAYGMVYYVCLGYLKNHEEAQDATQDVFIKIYNSLNLLDNNYTFFGWAQTIAINKSKDRLRSQKDYISYDDAIGAEEELIGDDNLEMLPDTYIIREEQRKIIENIMRHELSDVQYQTVYMHYYNNMSVEQIAALMNCPEGTVKTRLKNSRIKIKEGILRYERLTNDRVSLNGACPAIAMVLGGAINNTAMNFVPFAGAAAMGAAGGTAGAAVGSAVAGGVAGKGAILAGGGLLTKVIVGVAAVGVLGVGTVVVVRHNSGNATYETAAVTATDNDADITPSVSESEEIRETTQETNSASLAINNVTWLGTDAGTVDVNYGAHYTNTSEISLGVVFDESDADLFDTVYYTVYKDSSLVYTSGYGVGRSDGVYFPVADASHGISVNEYGEIPDGKYTFNIYANNKLINSYTCTVLVLHESSEGPGTDGDEGISLTIDSINPGSNLDNIILSSDPDQNLCVANYKENMYGTYVAGSTQIYVYANSNIQYDPGNVANAYLLYRASDAEEYQLFDYYSYTAGDTTSSMFFKVGTSNSAGFIPGDYKLDVYDYDGELLASVNFR